MKTTIDIPEKILADVMKYTGAKTKRAAVLASLEETIRLQKVREICAAFGTLDFGTNEEIESGDIAEIADREQGKAEV